MEPKLIALVDSRPIDSVDQFAIFKRNSEIALARRGLVDSGLKTGMLVTEKAIQAFKQAMSEKEFKSGVFVYVHELQQMNTFRNYTPGWGSESCKKFIQSCLECNATVQIV